MTFDFKSNSSCKLIKKSNPITGLESSVLLVSFDILLTVHHVIILGK